jgi:hypothetical protein
METPEIKTKFAEGSSLPTTVTHYLSDGLGAASLRGYQTGNVLKSYEKYSSVNFADAMYFLKATQPKLVPGTLYGIDLGVAEYELAEAVEKPRTDIGDAEAYYVVMNGRKEISPRYVKREEAQADMEFTARVNHLKGLRVSRKVPLLRPKDSLPDVEIRRTRYKDRPNVPCNVMRSIVEIHKFLLLYV